MDYLEAFELAATILDIDTWAEDFDEDSVEDRLYEVYEVDIVQFWKIAEALMKLTPTAELAISGEKARGFIKDGAFIVKEIVG